MNIKVLSICVFLLCVILAQSCVNIIGEDIFQMTAEIKTTDEVGKKMISFVRYRNFGGGNGEDGKYGTEDDDISEYVVTSQNEVESISTRYFGPGVDGLWFTRDDISDVPEVSNLGLIYQKDDSFIYVQNYGKDGLPKTSDDELYRYTKTFLNENVETIVNYIGQGADNIWMSDDDVVSHYTENTYNNRELLSEVRHFEVGEDALLFSDDDLIKGIETYEYDSLGRPSKIENIVLFSTLLELPGADLENRQIYEFEFNFKSEDLIEVKTIRKNQQSNMFYEGRIFADDFIVESYQLDPSKDLKIDVAFEFFSFRDFLDSQLRYESSRVFIPRVRPNGKLLDIKVIDGFNISENSGIGEIIYSVGVQGVRYIENNFELKSQKHREFYSGEFYGLPGSSEVNEIDGKNISIYVDLTGLNLMLNDEMMRNFRLEAIESNEIIEEGDGVSKNVYRKHVLGFDNNNSLGLRLKDKSTHVTVDKTI